MELNQNQVDLLAKYFADLSKILFASIVVGFFLPNTAGLIDFYTFFGGSLIATGFVVFSIRLLKTQEL